MKTKYITYLSAVLVLACVTLVPLQSQPPQYNVTFLPENCRAKGLNDLGEVVGAYWDYSEGPPIAFLYSNNTLLELGTLGGSSSWALSINNAGQIAGEAETPSSLSAFLYENNRMTSLGTLPGARGSCANAINEAGQAVGYSYDSDEQMNAVVFWQGQVINMQVGVDSNAYGINDNYDSSGFGQIVGTGGGFISYAFLYDNKQLTDLEFICKTASSSLAKSINKADQIIGSCQMNEYDSVAFFYDLESNKYTFIGNQSLAADINNSGQVVGMDTGENGQFPFLFMDGVEYNLNNLIPANNNLIDISPVAINNRGQILVNIDQGSALLTPVNQN